MSRAKDYALLSLQLNPRNDMPHALLGLIYARENRKEDARRESVQALSLNPKNDTAQRVLQGLKE